MKSIYTGTIYEELLEAMIVLWKHRSICWHDEEHVRA